MKANRVEPWARLATVLSVAALLAISLPVAGDQRITLRIDDSVEIEVTQSGSDRLSEIALDAAGPRLTLLTREADGVELLRVGWRGGFAFGKLASGEAGLSAVINESFDCDSWVAEGRQRRLAQIAAGALERLADGPPSAPEIESASTVALLSDLIELVCGTPAAEESPAAGGCYHDNRNSFSDCKECCERGDELLLAACGFASSYVCIDAPVYCGELVGGGCTAVVDLVSTDCVRSDCSGLPGDGQCPTPKPPCSGLCMNFCGIGWDSACGACPGPGDGHDQRACCT